MSSTIGYPPTFGEAKLSVKVATSISSSRVSSARLLHLSHNSCKRSGICRRFRGRARKRVDTNVFIPVVPYLLSFKHFENLNLFVRMKSIRKVVPRQRASHAIQHRYCRDAEALKVQRGIGRVQCQMQHQRFVTVWTPCTRNVMFTPKRMAEWTLPVELNEVPLHSFPAGEQHRKISGF